MEDKPLTPKDIAKRYGVTEHTTSEWRRSGRGPQWFKVGHRVFYSMEDVLAFEEQQKEEARDAG
jgi:predicted site-specific integrase-resolvase